MKNRTQLMGMIMLRQLLFSSLMLLTGSLLWSACDDQSDETDDAEDAAEQVELMMQEHGGALQLVDARGMFSFLSV